MLKPILFNTEMVKAILRGEKTSTRRIIKFENNESDKSEYYAGRCALAPGVFNSTAHRISKFPPYQVGDTLWVRETWQYIDFAGEDNGYVYKASQNGKDWEENSEGWTWKPSIHMPREATRIFLKVTDVKVEKLQDITEDEAKAEGIKSYTKDNEVFKYAVSDYWWINYHNKHERQFRGTWWQDMPRTANEAFKYLWDNRYNFPNDWCGNPWVWVIEFKRISKEEIE